MSGLATREVKSAHGRAVRSRAPGRGAPLPDYDPQALQRVASGRATPASVLTLQRMVGNQAAMALLRGGPVVQRVETEEGIEKTSGVLDTSAGQISNWSNLAALGTNPSGGSEAYKYGNTTTSGAQAGEAGGIIGGTTSLTSTVLNTKKSIEAGLLKGKETKALRGGQATWSAANREQKMTGVNATTSALSIPGQVLAATSGFSQVAANAGSTSAFAGMNNLLGGIGGIISLPIQAFQVLRTMRKAHKQFGRVKKLQEGLAKPASGAAENKKKIAGYDKLIERTKELYLAAKTDVDESISDRDIKYTTEKQKKSLAYKLDQEKIDKQIEARDKLQVAIDEATEQRRQIQEGQAAAEKAVLEAAERAKQGVETPDDIRAYALRKNKAGFMKKLIAIVGGILGIGGGIAATIAAFAAIGATAVVATASLATPVGWALCGVAALVGLTMAGYAFWKWASKRYKRAREAKMSKGASFLHAINPFSKSIGKSRREHNAERLYGYAFESLGTAGDATKAKQTINDLGLDWQKQKMDDVTNHKAASIKLIHAKMGS